MANNYTLGRGELWFSRFKPGTKEPDGERYIGNSPEFNATIETESLDHYSSDRGIREKDESIALQTNRTGSFTTDNVDPENLALFFLGSTSALTTTAGAVVDEAINDVKKGLTYQLGVTPSNPAGARDLDGTTAPVVSMGATPLVAGTDYTIDLALARLTILETSVTVTEGSDLTVDYSTKAGTRDRVISGSTPVEGALRYISHNPAGKQFDFYMPWVKLTPNGDFALKGDEWQTIPFNVEILKRADAEAIYIDGRPETT